MLLLHQRLDASDDLGMILRDVFCFSDIGFEVVELDFQRVWIVPPEDSLTDAFPASHPYRLLSSVSRKLPVEEVTGPLLLAS